MDTMQICRTYYGPNWRTNYAWWSAKDQGDQTWKVYFHADFVSSAHYSCKHSELFLMVERDMEAWIAEIDVRYQASHTK